MEDMHSDRGYTGQRREGGFGLMDYNARYYSAYLGRFVSPDSIIPDAGNSMDWDRYQYAWSNPVMNNDPSGHYTGLPEASNCGPDGINCEEGPSYWVTFTRDSGTSVWTPDEKNVVQNTAEDLGREAMAPLKQLNKLLTKLGEELIPELNPRALFNNLFGVVNFHKVNRGNEGFWGYVTDTTQVNILKDAGITNPYIGGANFIIHELGHILDNRLSYNPRDTLGSRYSGGLFPQRGTPERDGSDSNGNRYNDGPYGGYKGPYQGWQQSRQLYMAEEFADMLIGWTYNSWNGGGFGVLRAGWMNQYMQTPIWISLVR